MTLNETFRQSGCASHPARLGLINFAPNYASVQNWKPARSIEHIDHVGNRTAIPSLWNPGNSVGRAHEAPGPYTLLALFIMRLLPGSPRWLATRRRMDDAKTTLVDIEARVQRANWGDLFKAPRQTHHRFVGLLVCDLPCQFRFDDMAAEHLPRSLKAAA